MQQTAGDKGAGTVPAGGRQPDHYTVFLVEDDADDRTQTLRILRQSPHIHNVHWFESGDRLMAHLVAQGFYADRVAKEIPTLILLDLHLPGTSGMDILRDLKEHPLTQDIPIIVLTNDVSSERVLEAYRLQANAYLPKPVLLGNIHDVIYNGWGWPDRKTRRNDPGRV